MFGSAYSVRSLVISTTAASLLILSGGCSGIPGSLLGGKPDGSDSVKKCIDEAKANLKQTRQVKDIPDDTQTREFTQNTIAFVDYFLDCAVGPAKNDEAKLIRGHAIVSMLSRYAAYNACVKIPGLPDNKFGPYDDIEDDIAAT